MVNATGRSDAGGRSGPLSVRAGYGLVCGVLAVVLLGVTFWRLSHREETLLDAARKCIDAVDRGDAATLLRYVREDEKALLRLDERRLGSLLNGFVRARLHGFSPKGEDRVDRWGFMPTMEILRSYEGGDGREVVVAVTVTASEDGPKLLHCTEDLFAAGLRTYWPKDHPLPARGVVLNATALEQAISVLETLPLGGFAAQHSEDGLRYVTWRAALDSFQARSTLVRAQQP